MSVCIDRDLLKSLYLLDGYSGDEHEIIPFIVDYLYKNVNNFTIEMDSSKNLFIKKNTTNPEAYPCVVAHMDTIQCFNKPRQIYIDKSKNITARYDDGQQCGLNADDRNGVCIALQLLKEIPDIKVLLTTEEESGGFGAYNAKENIDFFSNVKYMMQADRKGNSDFITHTNGVDITDPLFIDDIYHIMNKYEYKESHGIFTDIGILSDSLKISGVNISCGYYNEHTLKENCNLDELEKCFNFMYDVIINLQDNGKFYLTPEASYGNLSGPFPYNFPTIDDFYEDKSMQYLIEDYCRTCQNMDCMHCNIFPY